jgi:hypothetical protein
MCSRCTWKPSRGAKQRTADSRGKHKNPTHKNPVKEELKAAKKSTMMQRCNGAMYVCMYVHPMPEEGSHAHRWCVSHSRSPCSTETLAAWVQLSASQLLVHTTCTMQTHVPAVGRGFPTLSQKFRPSAANTVHVACSGQLLLLCKAS